MHRLTKATEGSGWLVTRLNKYRLSKESFGIETMWSKCCLTCYHGIRQTARKEKHRV